ncbi:MAG: GtrA family protein [Bacillus sp. (in: Bacteria)]|nr:GtrA family protein [Bacillus sp. (in: firmicutes)]
MNYSFVRFILVGIVKTIFGLSVMYMCIHGEGFSYWQSTFIGNSIGACVSFYLNRTFTFKSDSAISSSVIRFVTVILCSYFISYRVGQIIVTGLLKSSPYITENVRVNLAVLLGTGLYTVFNYSGQKLFVFSRLKTSDKNVR